MSALKTSTTYAVVPLNSQRAAKSRLAGALADADRRALVRWMAGRVLDAIMRSEVVTAVAVVSPDADQLAWARARGAIPLLQHGSGINAGIEVGRRWAARAGAQTLLVALGDLPLLVPDEVGALVRNTLADAGPVAVALAPDRADAGTNLLALSPPDALPFAFGQQSFARFRALAAARGVAPHVLRARGTSFDVDAPCDLRELLALGLWQPLTPLAGEGAVVLREGDAR